MTTFVCRLDVLRKLLPHPNRLVTVIERLQGRMRKVVNVISATIECDGAADNAIYRRHKWPSLAELVAQCEAGAVFGIILAQGNEAYG